MLPLTTDPATRARYSQGGGIHRIVPAAVARPGTRAELRELLAWAGREGLAVTPRGAGSAMDGSSIGEGVVLDLTAFEGSDHRVPVAEGLTVRTPPGVPLGRIARRAAEHGLRLGPDPSSEPWATVAGAIATNAAGARSHRLGAMAEWVLAAELETTDGPLVLERGRPADPSHPVVQRFARDVVPLLDRHRAAIERRWPRTRKNTLGYALDRYWRRGDLLDLVIGSEGTLGVLTEATLRLERIPPHRASLGIALGDRRDLPRAVATIDDVQPTTIELLDRSFLRLVAPGWQGQTTSPPLERVAALLLVDLEAEDRVELDARVELVRERLAPIAMDQRIARDAAEIGALWSVRHAASPILAAIRDGRRSLQVIEDGCVPPERLGEYLEAIDGACRAAELDAVMFGHAGDGHVHVNLLPDLSRPDWHAAVRAVFDAVHAALLRLGGTPAGEHGAGRLRAAGVEAFLGAEAVACFRAIKAAFDPAGRFNPGVILPDGHDPLGRLKVGPDAAPLPPGLDDALRRIEEQRRWGESRWEGVR